MPAWKNGRAPLPSEPLFGMLNKSGGKVRLTFKLETDQLWLGTKERTEKIGMNSIRAVLSEPIEGHEEYHLMALQLGTTEGKIRYLSASIDLIKEYPFVEPHSLSLLDLLGPCAICGGHQRNYIGCVKMNSADKYTNFN